MLSLYKGRVLSPAEVPRLYHILDILARRAGLSRTPSVYYIPSHVMNGFATGTRSNAVIALSDGLLRRLDLRELGGMLAHEISHIRHNDLRVMGFADQISRLTSLFSSVGRILFLLNLPLLLFSDYHFAWTPILILLAAPTISALIQLALSRNREYDADLNLVSWVAYGSAV